MTSPPEPVHQLEPSNLLEPTDWTDSALWPSSGSGPSLSPRDGPCIPPQQPKDRMIADHPRRDLNGGWRSLARGKLLAGVVGAVAFVAVGFAAGAGLPQLAKINVVKMPSGGAQDTKAKPADADAQASADRTTTAGETASNASSAPQAVQAPNQNAGVPCDQQAWPHYDRECLKGSVGKSAARDSPAARTIVPDRNADGSPRKATQTAAGASPPAAPTTDATPAAPTTGATPPATVDRSNATPRVEQAATPEPSLQSESRSTKSRTAREKRRHENRYAKDRERTDQQRADRDDAGASAFGWAFGDARNVEQFDEPPRGQPSRRAERQARDASRRSSRRRDRGEDFSRRDSDVSGDDGIGSIAPAGSRYIILQRGEPDW